MDDVLARNQIRLLEADKRSNLLVSSVRINHLLDDLGLDLGHGEDELSQQLDDPVEPGLHQNTDSLPRPWDSNGNLALTLSRLDDLPHACTNTLCPADLGVLDHLEFGDVDIGGDFNAGDPDMVSSLVPEDIEVKFATSTGD